MAGVQVATNFDTRPKFIRYPLPSFYGDTAVPSVLDVYINGQLRRSEQVEAGRFLLEDIPAINGAGQMQIVTRDAVGRQQVYAEDFYLATDLLRYSASASHWTTSNTANSQLRLHGAMGCETT
jgi:outer membrane usher protein